jgi:hypothetical protein
MPSTAEDAEGSPASAAEPVADTAPPALQILGLANDDGTQKFDDDELPDNLFDAVNHDASNDQPYILHPAPCTLHLRS